jgi:hypothetical protein
MDMVLDFIASYEGRISTVEELISAANQAPASAADGLGELDEERGRLKGMLQKTLSHNCSLRRKDFERLIQGVLSGADARRPQLEAERAEVREKVRVYLDEQKQLAAGLRRQLVDVAQGSVEKGNLDDAISGFKTLYEGPGQEVLGRLRQFQAHLAAYQQELTETNRRLRSLVERGPSLRLEELRQLTSQIYSGEEDNGNCDRCQRDNRGYRRVVREPNGAGG